MPKLNMIVLVMAILCSAAVVGGRRPALCDYKYDSHSPFYWPGEEDMCTDAICKQYPDLRCYDYNATLIEKKVKAHYPEDIMKEVAYMQAYFDTYLPKPSYPGDYDCEGVCDRGPELLERVFTDIDVFEPNYGEYVKKRWLCHVAGPKIYRRQCRGRCNAMHGAPNMFCVPEVTVSLDVWVYCPNVMPGCRRIRLDVPLSCACKEMRCLKDRPIIPLPPPRLPQGVSTPIGPVNFVPVDPNPPVAG